MNSIERYKRRKLRLNSITMTPKNSSANQNLVNTLLCEKIDITLIDKTTNAINLQYDFEYDLSVSKEEAKEFWEKFTQDFNQERFDKLITDCKQNVISSITTPFGLGQIVAAYDKVGGNVDTIHNVRNDIYATVKERKNFESKNKYKEQEYHDGNSNYVKKKEEFQNAQKNETLIQDYSGKVMPQENPNDSIIQIGTEHIISAKEIHDDAGRILAELNGPDLANADTNLFATTKSINSSKGDDSASDFIERVKHNKEKIKILEAKESLTPEEEQGLARLKRVTDVDEQKIKDLDEEARKNYNKKINTTYYTGGKFVKNTALTSSTEGAKMGMQQAIGLVMTEFFATLFDEIIDIYKNGFSSGFENEKFFAILKARLQKIATRIKLKWKDVAIAFKDGFISGFISNLVTTVINMFITTGKRIIRIIREWIFSLFRAVKLLLFPPENMSFEDAMREAKKLLATGLIVSLGVIAEEHISAMLQVSVFLTPFEEILTSVFVGSLTGLAITMTVYYMDVRKNDKDVIKEMLAGTDEKLDNIERLLKSFRFTEESTYVKISPIKQIT